MLYFPKAVATFCHCWVKAVSYLGGRGVFGHAPNPCPIITLRNLCDVYKCIYINYIHSLSAVECLYIVYVNILHLLQMGSPGKLYCIPGQRARHIGFKKPVQSVPYLC